MTEIDPVFFLLRAVRQAQGQRVYQTLTQIVDGCLGSAEILEQGLVEAGFTFTPDAQRRALRDILLSSSRLRRSLEKACIVKKVKLPDGEMATYCFDEQRFLEHLVKKHALLRTFIAKRAYAGKPKAPETSGIIHKRSSAAVKTEDDKVDETPYLEDKMHTTIAAGLIADELPRDLVPRFLEAVEAANVFNGPGAVHSAPEIAPIPDAPMKETHVSPPRDKKRPLEEPKPEVTPGPSKKGTITSFFKKQ